MLTKGRGRGKSDFAHCMFQHGGQTNETVQLHGKIGTVNGLSRVLLRSCRHDDTMRYVTSTVHSCVNHS